MRCVGGSAECGSQSAVGLPEAKSRSMLSQVVPLAQVIHTVIPCSTRCETKTKQKTTGTILSLSVLEHERKSEIPVKAEPRH